MTHHVATYWLFSWSYSYTWDSCPKPMIPLTSSRSTSEHWQDMRESFFCNNFNFGKRVAEGPPKTCQCALLRKINRLRHSALVYSHGTKTSSQRGVLVTFCTTHTCCDCKTRMQVLTCMVSDIEIHNVDRESLEKQWNLYNIFVSVSVSVSTKGRIHWKTRPRTCVLFRVLPFFPPQASLNQFIKHWTASFESFIGTLWHFVIGIAVLRV